MDIIVPIIIIGIVCLQIFFFGKNFMRMNEFRNIFNVEDRAITKDFSTGLVNGLRGEGNKVFNSIVKSINKYLGNNTGSVIDFHLLKDTVDRHCDTIENDIATQTPMPLYLGLAGTMGGVILGLWDLLDSGAISTLMGQYGGETTQAAEGISSLLSGVAWAMVASICGIGLTTLSSWIFKKAKLNHEQGKDSFLAWMQADLLPELPTDTSDALTKLVRNLNQFNNMFAQNVSKLSATFNAVNASYKTQAEVIKAVHEMDVLKMAKANVMVLKQLEVCTDKLEDFNDYLDSVEGYTDAIHRFETLFNENEGKYHVLQEIRDFFNKYKGSIANVTTDADKAFSDSLRVLKESTQKEVNDVSNTFVDLSENFKKVIKDEQDTFQKFSADLRSQFDTQMKHLPQINKQLEQVAAIPQHIDKMLEKVEKANAKYADSLRKSVEEAIKAKSSGELVVSGAKSGGGMPTWMKIVAFCALIIIAASCVFNIAEKYWPIGQNDNATAHTSTEQSVGMPTDSVIKMPTDSVVKVTSDSIANNKSSKR